MKKLMMTVALVAITLGAQAQEKEKRTPEERAKAQTERMTKELGLSADQAAKLEPINLKYAQEGAALRAEYEAQREAMRKEGKGRKLVEAHDAEVKPILTPEQYEKWQALKAEKKEKMKEKRKEKHGDMREHQKQ